jgi:hypothetical protein
LHQRLSAQGRILTADWDLYDTRHAVFQPARMSVETLEEGYRRAYRDFYRWRAIARGACAHDNVVNGVRHFAYAAGWKKFEPLWDLVIRAKQVGAMLPVLEMLLLTSRGNLQQPAEPKEAEARLDRARLAG